MAVKFAQHVDIDAPPDRVWRVLTDPNLFAGWFPDMDRAEVGSVTRGGTFRYQEGNEQGSGTFSEVEPQRRLRIVTSKGDGSPVTHTFELKREGGLLGVGGNDCQVDYTMEYDPPGGLISDFVAGGNPRDMMKVRNALQAIKGLVEGK